MRKSAIILATLVLFACSSNKSPVYQGYAEGEFVNITSASSGRIEALNVSRGDEINEGQLAFALEAVFEKEALAKAQAQYNTARARLDDAAKGMRSEEIDVIRASLRQAKAQLDFLEAQLKRDEALFANKTISEASIEKSRTEAKSARAAVAKIEQELRVATLPAREDVLAAYRAEADAAEAAVKQAEWQLAQKQAFSPYNATVYDVFFKKGEWVAAGTPVVRILPPENIKIRFFMPQTQAAELAAGQIIYLNGGSTAKITYISPEVEFTPPVIYSNSTNHKLVFMIEAVPDGDAKFHPGQPVEVSLQR